MSRHCNDKTLQICSQTIRLHLNSRTSASIPRSVISNFADNTDTFCNCEFCHTLKFQGANYDVIHGIRQWYSVREDNRVCRSFMTFPRIDQVCTQTLETMCSKCSQYSGKRECVEVSDKFRNLGELPVGQ